MAVAEAVVLGDDVAIGKGVSMGWDSVGEDPTA